MTHSTSIYMLFIIVPVVVLLVLSMLPNFEKKVLGWVIGIMVVMSVVIFFISMLPNLNVSLLYLVISLIVFLLPVVTAIHRSKNIQPSKSDLNKSSCQIHKSKLSIDTRFIMIATCILYILAFATFRLLPFDLFTGGVTSLVMIFIFVIFVASLKKVEHIAVSMWLILALLYICVVYGTSLLHRMTRPLKKNVLSHVIIQVCVYTAMCWVFINKMYFSFFRMQFVKMDENLNNLESWMNPIASTLLKYKSILIHPISFILYGLLSPGGMKFVGRCILNFLIPLLFVHALTLKANGKSSTCPSRSKEPGANELLYGALSEQEQKLQGYMTKAAIFKDIFKIAVLLIVVIVSICCFYIYKIVVSNGDNVLPLTPMDIMKRSTLFVLNLVKIVDFNEYSEINTCKTFMTDFEIQLYTCRCQLDRVELVLKKKQDKDDASKLHFVEREAVETYAKIRRCVGTYAKNVIKFDVVCRGIVGNISVFNENNVSKDSIHLLTSIQNELPKSVEYHYTKLTEIWNSISKLEFGENQMGGEDTAITVEDIVLEEPAVELQQPPVKLTEQAAKYQKIILTLNNLQNYSYRDQVTQLGSVLKDVRNADCAEDGQNCDSLKRRIEEIKHDLIVKCLNESDRMVVFDGQIAIVEKIISECVVSAGGLDVDKVTKLVQSMFHLVTSINKEQDDKAILKQCVNYIYVEELKLMPKNIYFYLAYVFISFILSVAISQSVKSNHIAYVHASTILVIIMFAIIHYILYFKEFTKASFL
jgi:hypothetical protein